MPPEQASGKRSLIGVASDIYSLGAVLYELLAGRPPFRGETPAETLRQVESLDPVSPRLLSPAVPRDLETICLKCLEKEPHKRYGTSQQLAEDLNRLLSGEPISARPIGQAERTWRWCKRQPVVASLIATIVAVLISGIGASSYFAVRASNQATAEARQRKRADQEAERATTALQAEAEARAREEERRKEAEEARAISESQSRAAQWNLYLTRMRTMLTAWTSGQLGQLQRILEEAVPKTGELDFRGWEYYFFQDEVNKYAYVLPVPKEQRFAKWLAWSPDGTHLATSSGGVEIWQSDQRRLVRQFGGGFEGGPVAWHPNGDQIAIANDDGTIRVWNPLSGDLIREFAAHHTTLMRCLVWSPDGKFLASGDGMYAGIKVWDAATGNCIHSFADSREDDWIYALDWHPDGKRIIASQRRGRVRIWDTTTGKPIYDRKINDHSTRFADWSPDGSLLAIGGGAPDFSIIIADHEAKEIRRFTVNGTPTSGSWSSDGRQFAVGTRSQQLEVWDVATGVRVQAPNLHSAQLRQAVWSPNGEFIGTSTDDKIVRLVRRQALKSESDKTGPPRLRRPIWSRDDKALTGFTSDGKLMCVGIADQVVHESITTPGQRVRGFQYTPDGLWILAWKSFNSFDAWIHDSRKATPKIPLRTSNFAVSPNGKQLMSRDLREVTNVLEAATGKLQFSMAPDLFQFAWSPDGSMIAIGGTNPRIEFWSPKTGKLLFRLPSEYGIEKLVWRSDGARVAAITVSGSLSIFDVVNRKSLPPIWGHSDVASEIAWSGDGRRIATGDNIGTIKIWDADTGAEMLSFPAHKQAITALQWSSDSRRLLSADATDEVRIWGSSEMPEIPHRGPEQSP
jgi:WD40 repeat protein